MKKLLQKEKNLLRGLFVFILFISMNVLLHSQEIKDHNFPIIIEKSKDSLSGQQNVVRFVQVSLPNQNNVIKKSWPLIACWFWTDEEFKPEGYKRVIDLYEKHTSAGLLTTSLRHPGELKDNDVHDQIQAASEYAREKGIGLVMDLDVRLARETFKKRYPDELQEILLIREFSLNDIGKTVLIVKSPSFSDHYTTGRPPYYPVNSRLLRVYSYEKENTLIKNNSLRDITARCRATGDKDQLSISVNNEVTDRGRIACAMISVTIHTPDVFAPHLLSFQREILRQYGDAHLVGACKDEWGFPGRFNPPTSDLWYSVSMAKEYKKRRPGHELLRDMLLMSVGEEGKETERVAAINHYMEMYFQRNAQIETDFYNAVKETFGQTAMVATHPTWFPYPNSNEIFKNGLDWWSTKRDLAQTDEYTPFCVRTALSKKWQSPLWYNMFYDKSVETYSREIWISTLGGGRLNFHEPYPSILGKTDVFISFFKGDLFRAAFRIELLNYISASPVYCPVAVIFGHPGSLNWANSNGFGNVGLDIINRLWEKGFYTDLIPSSEITNGSLKTGENGKIQYGFQEYEAVLYYNPEYDYKSVASFFKKAADKNGTAIFRVGNQTMDFDGKVISASKYLSEAMNVEEAADSVISFLKKKGIEPQTPCVMRGAGGFPASMMPKPAGHLRLIDGTYILAAGEKNIMGDTIQTNIIIDGKEVTVDAIGIAAIRFDKSGNLDALACSGLKLFHTGSFKIELPERMDIALFRENGLWRGIIHGSYNEIPENLIGFTKDWIQVREPVPYRN